MTVLSPAQIVGTALPSLAPSAPMSSGPAGAGLGGAIHDTWQRGGQTLSNKRQADRRSALRKARKNVEERAETKAERLARQQGARTTGSEAERRETRGSVAKAAAAFADVPMDKEFSGEEYRALRERLRQRYPGRKLSDMLAEAAKFEQMLMDDPVQAREVLHAGYSRAPFLPHYVEPKHASGLRGSLQRARIEQQDALDLKEWVALYGRRLPQILADLEAMDRHLTTDPAMASARIAAKFGAPAIDAEVGPYLVRQAAKAEKERLQTEFNNRHRGVQLAIEHGHVPGDDETLNEIAAIMVSPQFEHHPTDGFGNLKRAAAITQHPEHKWLTGKKAAAKQKRDPGQLSISGGAPPDHSRNKGTGGVRDSIARVRGAM